MKNISIPHSFFSVKYDGSKYPGKFENLKDGANCQSFAYEILRYFRYSIGNLRSSDLWDDKTYTRKVKKLIPLDIALFGKEMNAYGAHVGVCLGNNKIIHLSKEIGQPIIWDINEFKKYPKYKIFIGGKRIKNITATMLGDSATKN